MHICVITPSFNQCEFLRQTVESVLSQRGDFTLSYLVMDGGSTDGTVDFLKSVDDPRLIWRSEIDNGQSDAVNKGLSLATGDIVGWLNSDDLYTPDALKAVCAAFESPTVQWVVGRYQIIDVLGQDIRSSIVRYKNRFLNRYRYRNLLQQNFIAQPAVFWRRSFGEQAGPLDTSLHYTMDYDLWLRMGRLADPVILDRTVARFRVHATSKTGRINRRQFDEGFEVAKRYFGKDRLSRTLHRFNIEKIVWAYRLLNLFGK